MNDAASPSPEKENPETPSAETPQEVSPQITTTQGLDEAAVQKRGLKGVLQRLTPTGRRERAVARSQGGAEVVQLVRSLQVHLERQSEVMEVLPEAIKGLSEVVEASRKQSDQLEQVGTAMTKFNDTLFSMDNTTRRLVEGSRASEETLTQLLQKSERRFYGLAILLVVVVVLLGGTIAFLSNPDAVRSLSSSWSDPKPEAPEVPSGEDAEKAKPGPVEAKEPEAVTPPSKEPKAGDVIGFSDPKNPSLDLPPKDPKPKPEEEATKPPPKKNPAPNPVPPPKPEGTKPAPVPKPVPPAKPTTEPEVKPVPEAKPTVGSKPILKKPEAGATKDPASGEEKPKPETKPAAKAKPAPPKAPLKVSL